MSGGLNGGYLARVGSDRSDDVIHLLTTRQHLRPHQPLRDVLRAVMDDLGCCPRAVARAVEWLSVDPAKPVGRLRRGELIQLGRSIARFWRRAGRSELASDLSRDLTADNSPQ